LIFIESLHTISFKALPKKLLGLWRALHVELCQTSDFETNVGQSNVCREGI
jgi:hypothetical protein